MKVVVLGVGYVGLISGSCLADIGHDVSCVDIDSEKIKKLNSGKPTIYEPGLEELLKKNVKTGKLKFFDNHDLIANADIIMMALPTPPNEDGSADLSYLLGAVDSIADKLTKNTVLVTKSTVPVGTAKKVEAVLAKNKVKHMHIVSNPEFLKEGMAINDFMHPDRIVVGADSKFAFEKMRELYNFFIEQEYAYIEMDRESSELTKYAANSFLATKVSFMNEIANIAEKVGANIHHVKEGISHDTRIGKKFLNAGIGFGGSCFPKDVLALKTTAQEYDYDFQIAHSVLEINQAQKSVIVNKIMREFGSVEGKTITVWGLAFKPETDDVREAPAIVIIKKLLREGAIIHAHDPEAIETTKQAMGDEAKDIKFFSNHIEALDGADMLVVATEWPIYVNTHPDDISDHLKGGYVFDGRNIFDSTKAKRAKLQYFGIGV